MSDKFDLGKYIESISDNKIWKEMPYPPNDIMPSRGRREMHLQADQAQAWRLFMENRTRELQSLEANGGGDSDSGSTASVPVVPVPSAPVLTQTSKDADARTVVLAASTVETADTYQFQIKVDSGDYTTLQNTSSTTFTSGELSSGDITFRVRAVNSGGFSPASNEIQYTVPAAPTLTGELIAGTYNNYSELELTVSADPANQYQYQKSTNGGTSWSFEGTNSGTTRTFSRIASDYKDHTTRDIWAGSYKFRARVLGSDFNSEWSTPLDKEFEWVVDTQFPTWGDIKADTTLYTNRVQRVFTDSYYNSGKQDADNPHIIFLRTYTDTYTDSSGTVQTVTYNPGDIWTTDALGGNPISVLRGTDLVIERPRPFSGNTSGLGVWQWLSANPDSGSGTSGNTRGFLYDFARFQEV